MIIFLCRLCRHCMDTTSFRFFPHQSVFFLLCAPWLFRWNFQSLLTPPHPPLATPSKPPPLTEIWGIHNGRLLGGRKKGRGSPENYEPCFSSRSVADVKKVRKKWGILSRAVFRQGLLVKGGRMVSEAGGSLFFSRQIWLFFLCGYFCRCGCLTLGRHSILHLNTEGISSHHKEGGANECTVGEGSLRRMVWWGSRREV